MKLCLNILDEFTQPLLHCLTTWIMSSGTNDTFVMLMTGPEECNIFQTLARLNILDTRGSPIGGNA